MKQQIASAFEHRQRPAVVTAWGAAGTLGDDARHFQGMEWTQVGADDWAGHSDAFYGFSPAAFLYFLPSLLILSLDPSNKRLSAADALVASLDTSGDPDLWPEWFNERLGQLTSAELKALRAWSMVYAAGAEEGEGSEIARVQDTLTMLEMTLQN